MRMTKKSVAAMQKQIVKSRQLVNRLEDVYPLLSGDDIRHTFGGDAGESIIVLVDSLYEDIERAISVFDSKMEALSMFLDYVQEHLNNSEKTR